MGRLSTDQNKLSTTSVRALHRSALKRIVVTSSTAAVRSTLPKPKLFTEADFNEQAIQVVERDGRAASGLSKYQASKTLAEKGTQD
jgi:nucleoside-diphosphate-sugar epimerase